MHIWLTQIITKLLKYEVEAKQKNLKANQSLHDDELNFEFFVVQQMCFNSHGKHQKAYLSFGTDLAHIKDVTESLMIGNENIDQNVQLE